VGCQKRKKRERGQIDTRTAPPRREKNFQSRRAKPAIRGCDKRARCLRKKRGFRSSNRGVQQNKTYAASLAGCGRGLKEKKSGEGKKLGGREGGGDLRRFRERGFLYERTYVGGEKPRGYGRNSRNTRVGLSQMQRIFLQTKGLNSTAYSSKKTWRTEGLTSQNLGLLRPRMKRDGKCVLRRKHARSCLIRAGKGTEVSGVSAKKLLRCSLSSGRTKVEIEKVAASVKAKLNVCI